MVSCRLYAFYVVGNVFQLIPVFCFLGFCPVHVVDFVSYLEYLFFLYFVMWSVASMCNVGLVISFRFQILYIIQRCAFVSRFPSLCRLGRICLHVSTSSFHLLSALKFWGGFLIRRRSAIRKFFAGFLRCDSRTIMRSFLKKITRKFTGNLLKNRTKFL